jgi:hypothetical protein
MSSSISSSPFQNMKQFLQILSLAPGIARRSSERFQLRRAITLNPCIVCGIRGYRYVRLIEGFVGAHSVHRSDQRISINWRIFPWLQRKSSSPVSSSILVLRFLQFLGFGEVAPCSPAPLPRRRGALPLARGRAAPAGATSGGGAAARRGWPVGHGIGRALPARALTGATPARWRACPTWRGRPPGGGRAPPSPRAAHCSFSSCPWSSYVRKKKERKKMTIS